MDDLNNYTIKVSGDCGRDILVEGITDINIEHHHSDAVARFVESIARVQDINLMTDEGNSLDFLLKADPDKHLKRVNAQSAPFKLYGTMMHHRSQNVGESDYAKRVIQPWDIWKEYELNPWEADIVKRVLRKKVLPTKNPIESRIEDYEKIKHVCEEMISQLKEKL